MNFLEKDLEEIIFTAERKKLQDRGLFIGENAILKRQLKIGNYGICDLISYSRPFYHPYEREVVKGEIVVFELKKERISVSTFMQAANYLQGVKRYLEKRGVEQNYDYKIVLIGREFDVNSSFAYLSDIIDNYSYINSIDRPSLFNLQLFTYSVGIDGLVFKEISGYCLTNEGF